MTQDLVVQKTATPITINGLADEAVWALVDENIVDNTYVGEREDEYDSEGRFKMLWDDTYVYFICDVWDLDLVEDSPGANENDESFDMFFDPWLDGGDAPQEDDVLLTVEFSFSGDCSLSGAKGGFTEFDTTNVIAKCTETDNGYMIEAAIPIEDLQITPGDAFGFDLRINDDDDGDGRDTQVAWFAEVLGDWNKPSALAELVLAPTVVGVADNRVAPMAFELLQNYPNPFNPTTTISYTVQKTGAVELKVYDLLGQEVATLVNDVKTAGVHHVTFDAHELSSGVYIYTLKSEIAVLANKMILIK
jgi:hypothetical protein